VPFDQFTSISLISLEKLTLLGIQLSAEVLPDDLLESMIEVG